MCDSGVRGHPQATNCNSCSCARANGS